MNNLAVFSGDSNKKLAQDICKHIGINLSSSFISHFPDGETCVKIEEVVRGKNCFIIQPTSPPVDNNLMELLVFIDCLKRASAKRITVVMPYFGYARQDRKDAGRVPITAKLVANLITSAGADSVLTMDLHSKQIEGFFDITVDHLSAFPAFVEYYRKQDLTNTVVLSPDVGNMKMAGAYAQELNLGIAVIDKRRKNGEEVVSANIVGDVKGKNVLMADDMISTAGTIASAATFAKKKGALSVQLCATHGLFCGGAIDKLMNSGIDKIIVSDTVPLTKRILQNIETYSLSQKNTDIWPEIAVVSVAKLLGEAIVRIYDNRSVSILLKSDYETGM